jgi:deoxyribonucleoside regulator
MVGQHRSVSRNEMLADVAEMYYLEGLTQEEIAGHIHLTRSMVSRMLTEARQKGIIEFRIHRPLSFDHELENEFQEQFQLEAAHVIVKNDYDGHQLEQLGKAAGNVLVSYLTQDTVLGLAWGTSIRATIESLEVKEAFPIKIVQLAGAGDSRIREFDGHALLQHLVQKLGGEGFYMNAPIIVETPEIARSLISSKTIRETIAMTKQCDVALLGIGSTNPRYSTIYQLGYFSLEDMNRLREEGAVGNVCGMHFTINGDITSHDFQNRLISISKEDLFSIPIRLGVAGGEGKVKPMLGALRGGFINVIVTDNFAAREVLRLAQET